MAVLFSMQLAAAETDRKAPVLIEASEVLIDEPKGISTYRGEVLFQQGEMSLRADQVSVFSSDRSLHRIEAEGTPVFFEIKSDNGKTTRAEAKKMSYQMSDGHLLMEGNAQLWQKGNHFSGGRIEFDVYNDRILASGQGHEQQRVRVVIQPEVLHQKSRSEPDGAKRE
ncbi:hypothetical protein MNBD_GAMMA18-1673 [hydrothermal vent metagenome]|uniref:Organic solvent tolerance-like N-terminal domain-containing protein n=1 Tax=hydrothermal vent metagenome TaxID=652676 RepID=A0A3B0ZKQ4_9ZZZZ